MRTFHYHQSNASNALINPAGLATTLLATDSLSRNTQCGSNLPVSPNPDLIFGTNAEISTGPISTKAPITNCSDVKKRDDDASGPISKDGVAGSVPDTSKKGEGVQK